MDTNQNTRGGGRPYRGVREDERREERKSRLVATGLELFATEGYAHVPIERICKVSHVTTRHFYELFPNKEGLLAAVLEEVMDDARAAVAGALAADTPDPLERARLGISAFIHSYLDDPRHARITLVEVVGVSMELERYRREMIHEFARIIEEESRGLARRGVIAERDYSLASLAMAGAVNELLIDWVNTEKPPPVASIIDELIYMFRAVIRGLEIKERKKGG